MTRGMEISRRTNIPKPTVFRVLSLIREKKTLQHKKGAGRPTKIQGNDKKKNCLHSKLLSEDFITFHSTKVRSECIHQQPPCPGNEAELPEHTCCPSPSSH